MDNREPGLWLYRHKPDAIGRTLVASRGRALVPARAGAGVRLARGRPYIYRARGGRCNDLARGRARCSRPGPSFPGALVRAPGGLLRACAGAPVAEAALARAGARAGLCGPEQEGPRRLLPGASFSSLLLSCRRLPRPPRLLEQAGRGRYVRRRRAALLIRYPGRSSRLLLEAPRAAPAAFENAEHGRLLLVSSPGKGRPPSPGARCCCRLPATGRARSGGRSARLPCVRRPRARRRGSPRPPPPGRKTPRI